MTHRSAVSYGTTGASSLGDASVHRAAHWAQLIDWNDDQIETLRTLWAAGHSSIEIGRRMGITKNAAIGKARRLNLPSRPSPIQRDGEPKPYPVRRLGHARTLPLLASETTGEPIRRQGDWITPERDEILKRWWPLYKPRIEILRIMAEAPGPLWPSAVAVTAYAYGTLKLRRPADLQAAAKPAARPAPRPAPVVRREPVPQVYAPIRGCCWPIGDVGMPDFRFCDQPHRNRTYCSEHAAIAYVRPAAVRRYLEATDA